MKPRDKHQIFHMLFQFWSNRLFLQAYHKNMRTVTWRLEGSNCTHSHIIWKCPENNIIYIENNTQFEISLDSSRAELILCYSNPTEDIIYHHTKQRLMTKSNHKHSSPCSASSLHSRTSLWAVAQSLLHSHFSLFINVTGIFCSFASSTNQAS